MVETAIETIGDAGMYFDGIKNIADTPLTTLVDTLEKDIARVETLQRGAEEYHAAKLAKARAHFGFEGRLTPTAERCAAEAADEAARGLRRRQREAATLLLKVAPAMREAAARLDRKGPQAGGTDLRLLTAHVGACRTRGNPPAIQ